MEYGRAVIVDHLESVALRPSKLDIYDREILVQTLFEDPESGAEHYLIRYPAGLETSLHTHTRAHTFVVLEGRLEVNGQVIGPNAYAHFPAGEPMVHTSAGGGSCLFVVVFDGPVDMQVVELPV
jgi:quercetin dioxygenase-like cupin family protein